MSVRNGGDSCELHEILVAMIAGHGPPGTSRPWTAQLADDSGALSDSAEDLLKFLKSLHLQLRWCAAFGRKEPADSGAVDSRFVCLGEIQDANGW